MKTPNGEFKDPFEAKYDSREDFLINQWVTGQPLELRKWQWGFDLAEFNNEIFALKNRDCADMWG